MLVHLLYNHWQTLPYPTHLFLYDPFLLPQSKNSKHVIKIGFPSLLAWLHNIWTSSYNCSQKNTSKLSVSDHLQASINWPFESLTTLIRFKAGNVSIQNSWLKAFASYFFVIFIRARSCITWSKMTIFQPSSHPHTRSSSPPCLTISAHSAIKKDTCLSLLLLPN